MESGRQKQDRFLECNLYEGYDYVDPRTLIAVFQETPEIQTLADPEGYYREIEQRSVTWYVALGIFLATSLGSWIAVALCGLGLLNLPEKVLIALVVTPLVQSVFVLLSLLKAGGKKDS